MSIQVINNSEWHTLESFSLEGITSLPPLSPMHTLVLDFLASLSQALLKSRDVTKQDDWVALGFWLRKSNLVALGDTFQRGVYQPLGLVSHYTPANVDTMFVYSWVCSLLAGNNNVVRISSRHNESREQLVLLIDRLLQQPQFCPLAERNIFIRYEHDSPNGRTLGIRLSQVSDARLIWGGDDSVQAIRQYPSKPRCRDIAFADRYSALVVDFDKIADDEIEQSAQRIWRDISTFDQQGCSSPKVMFWRGDNRKRSDLLNEISQLAAQQAGSIQNRNEQLVFAQQLQALALVKHSHSTKNFAWLDATDNLTRSLSIHQGNNNLLCYSIDSLADILPFADSKLQTLTYLGFDKTQMIKFLRAAPISGIDRIVPSGEALSFSPQWDGYELMTQLTRSIEVR